MKSMPSISKTQRKQSEILNQKSPILMTSLVLFLIATAIAGYLAWYSFSGGAVAGCGPESGCNQVLSSRWSSFFGIPVSVLALSVYIGLIIGIMRLCFTKAFKTEGDPWGLVIPLAFIVIGAGIWFVVVQLIMIKSICYFCMAGHLSGVIGASAVLFQFRRVRQSATADRIKKQSKSSVKVTNQSFLRLGLYSFIAVFALILGQLMYQPNTHKTTELDGNKAQTSYTGKKRTISLHHGEFQLNLNELPIMGSPDADHVIVSLFDYTCRSCRRTHSLLSKAQATFSNKLAIVTIPMPIDADCNSFMQRTNGRTTADHENACKYARAGLAVWRANRDVFQQFDKWMFKTEKQPPIGMVYSYAEDLIGKEAFDKALSDKWVDEILELSVTIFEANYTKHGSIRMPQLVVGNLLATGAPKDIDSIYRLLEKQFGLKHQSI